MAPADLPDRVHHVFVYGTLKAGFRNAHVNEGRPVGGAWMTARPHPLHIIGRRRLPWLLDRPGEGLPVQGEVVSVDDAGLARMDALERLDDPTWYVRRRIEVVPAEGGSPLEAWVYFGSEAGFDGTTVYAGPLAAYTREHEREHPPESD